MKKPKITCAFCGLGKDNITIGEMLFPLAFLAQYESQAIKNHSQSLRTLMNRGGLSWKEAHAIIFGISFDNNIKEDYAKNDILVKFKTWNTGAIQQLIKAANEIRVTHLTSKELPVKIDLLILALDAIERNE